MTDKGEVIADKNRYETKLEEFAKLNNMTVEELKADFARAAQDPLDFPVFRK